MHRAASTRRKAAPVRRLGLVAGARAALWLSALLLATSPVSAVLHFLLIPHLVCEHGKLEHVEGGRTGSVLRTPSSEGAHPERRAVPDSSRTRLSHAHCTIFAMARVHGAPSQGPGAAPAIPPAAKLIDIEWAPLPSQAPRSILAFAPKTSPPEFA